MSAIAQADPGKRSFILTRSGFGGIQRTGAAIWSGDIATRWSNLREQIAAGISVGLAGMPYWTFDIGGFTPEDRYKYFEGGAAGHLSEVPAAHRVEWQEINLRWFQFGAFVPLFRSHGQFPYREIFNLADEGSAVYDSLVCYTKLRYRLMPYIYTLAGDAWQHDGTIMRGLAMDFPDDPDVRNINDQYLFGPAFLVNPVSDQGARSRAVYLPAGADWYDFNTGALHAGGQTIDASAPLARMPLFVRAGSIVPTGPDAPTQRRKHERAASAQRLYRCRRCVRYLRGRRTELRLRGRRMVAYPGALRRRFRDRHARRTRGSLRRHAGYAPHLDPLDRWPRVRRRTPTQLDTAIDYNGAEVTVERPQ